jgi:hypothetical protein
MIRAKRNTDPNYIVREYTPVDAPVELLAMWISAALPHQVDERLAALSGPEVQS